MRSALPKTICQRWRSLRSTLLSHENKHHGPGARRLSSRRLKRSPATRKLSVSISKRSLEEDNASAKKRSCRTLNETLRDGHRRCWIQLLRVWNDGVEMV